MQLDYDSSLLWHFENYRGGGGGEGGERSPAFRGEYTQAETSQT